MDAVLGTFGISWQQLLENTATFLILTFLLYKFAYKPALAMLDKRKKLIEKSMQEVKDIEKQRDQMKKEYRKVLNEAAAEAKQIVQNAVDQSGILAKKIDEDARKSAEDLLKKAHAEIDIERSRMYTELKADIGSLVVSTVSKVLKDSLTDEEQKKLADKALREIIQ